LTIEKRRLESDLAAHQRELDDAVMARRVAEERAEKLAADLTHLNDQIRFEQSKVTSAESRGKQLEVKIRELTLHIEQLESATDGKKNMAKLQSRVSI
jgi:chromosome segregation ATPase